MPMTGRPVPGLRTALIALGAAALAVSYHTVAAQDDDSDQSQDMAWINAQKAYLARLKPSAGWQQLEGGLRWRRVAGDGAGTHPTIADRVAVHYTGTLIDGTTIDSSYKRGQPAEFPLGGVLRAWQLAIPQMGVGDTIEIAAPAELAYGARGAGDVIPGGATLLFKVKLLAIRPGQ